jgi:hypothetical protein
MAKEKFIPTDNDAKFLAAFLDRNLGEKHGTVCKKVGLPPNWYSRRVNTSSGFADWFTREIMRRQGVKVADILDMCIKALQNTKHAPNPQLVKVVLDRLAPSKTLIDLTMKDEEDAKEPHEIRREIIAMLDEEMKSVCSKCGAPLIDWEAWRYGGDPNEGKEVES